jgi:hypothetical protein
LKIKLKGHHFNTVEVMEAELQAVLNTLTEHGYHDAFRNGRRGGNSAYARKGTASKVTVGSRPKVSFDQMAAPVPEIMDGYLYRTSVRKLELKVLLDPCSHSSRWVV